MQQLSPQLMASHLCDLIKAHAAEQCQAINQAHNPTFALLTCRCCVAGLRGPA